MSSLEYLVSMITGQFNDQVFIQSEHNSKLTSAGQSSQFKFKNSLEDGTPISSLFLERVYVITSDKTGSASENLINGLDPYIDVIQVGSKTMGKNEVNYLIYSNVGNVLQTVPNHKLGLYIVAGKNANIEGFKNFEDGLVPSKLTQC